MEYYTKNALKTSGWTEGMIRDLLGEADLIYAPSCAVFSGFKEFTKRYFYEASRVDDIEKTEAFKERRRTKAVC